MESPILRCSRLMDIALATLGMDEPFKVAESFKGFSQLLIRLSDGDVIICIDYATVQGGSKKNATVRH